VFAIFNLNLSLNLNLNLSLNLSLNLNLNLNCPLLIKVTVMSDTCQYMQGEKDLPYAYENDKDPPTQPNWILDSGTKNRY